MKQVLPLLLFLVIVTPLFFPKNVCSYTRVCRIERAVELWPQKSDEKTPEYSFNRTVILETTCKHSKEVCDVFITDSERSYIATFLSAYKDDVVIDKNLIRAIDQDESLDAIGAIFILRDFRNNASILGSTVGNVRNKMNLPAYNEQFAQKTAEQRSEIIRKNQAKLLEQKKQAREEARALQEKEEQEKQQAEIAAQAAAQEAAAQEAIPEVTEEAPAGQETAEPTEEAATAEVAPEAQEEAVQQAVPQEVVSEQPAQTEAPTQEAAAAPEEQAPPAQTTPEQAEQPAQETQAHGIRRRHRIRKMA